MNTDVSEDDNNKKKRKPLSDHQEEILSCAVIHVYLKRNIEHKKNAPNKLQEAVSLTQAISLEAVYSHSHGITQFSPATLLTKGIVEKYQELCKEKEIDIVIINYPLTPIQQRNLEKELNTKVIDRTGLILEIFGKRAQTKEGRLQVELASLSFQRSRLVRSWTHLERQKGGFGFTGGPGETQIELDRRMIDDRITKIKYDLEKVIKTREQNRKKRKSTPYPVVALVGYTNAGKSTLFNTLTNAGVFAEDLLFATLDPTMRMYALPSGNEIILSDTVGFISDLPTQLVAAFRATLEEVLEADVILHVRDIASEGTEIQKKDVLKILKELGLSSKSLDEKLVEVLNKTDLLDDEAHQSVMRYAKFHDDVVEKKERQERIMLSAAKADNIDTLIDIIERKISKKLSKKTYIIPIANGKAIAWAQANMNVLEQEVMEDNCLQITTFIDEMTNNKFITQFGDLTK